MGNICCRYCATRSTFNACLEGAEPNGEPILKNAAIFLFLISSTAALAVPAAVPVTDNAAPGMVTAWVRVAMERDPFSVTGLVRFGSGVTWSAPKKVSGATTCLPENFGLERSGWNAGRTCELQKTVPAVLQMAQPAMPVVNKALFPVPNLGFANARHRPLTKDELAPGSPWIASPTDVGAFREPCGAYSHISNDDPIVYPNQPGMSHLHTFVGNTGAKADSTYTSLMAGGLSTCAGGSLNRTAYWMPSIIDTSTGQPMIPISTNFYYKLGYLGVKAGTVKPFPEGLRMIAGDSSSTQPGQPYSHFACIKGGDGQWHSEIPPCAGGGDLVVNVRFPQCWDGINLDSPDHQSHMAYGIAPKGCPKSHPIALPEVTQNVHYAPGADGTINWRLSSDKYVGPSGYSLHSDWYGAWDRAIMRRFIDNCLNGNQDCHDMILGDNTIIY